MIPTIDWIKENYKKFNNQFFDGTLITPKFELSSTFSFAGYVKWKYIPNSPIHTVYKGTRLKRYRQINLDTIILQLSTLYDKPIIALEETLLHEMIHVYFIQNNKPEVNHGYEFQRKAFEINKYGYNIGTYAKGEFKLSDHVNRKSYILYIFKNTHTNQYGYCSSLRPNKDKAKELVDYHKNLVLIGECVSKHDMFQGRKPTLASFGSRCTGYYFKSKTTYESIWATATNKLKYLI